MAATAARGQFGDGSTPKFAHCILVYLCAKIGAFIKKCTIGLNILGKPPHYNGIRYIHGQRQRQYVTITNAGTQHGCSVTLSLVRFDY